MPSGKQRPPKVCLVLHPVLINPATPALEVSQESCGEGENEKGSSVGRMVVCPAVCTALTNGSWGRRGQDCIPGVASAWEVGVGRDPGDFLLPVICLGFPLCRITSSMASSQQPALLRSQLCHAHLLPEAPSHLQRDPGRSQDHQVLSPDQ